MELNKKTVFDSIYWIKISKIVIHFLSCISEANMFFFLFFLRYNSQWPLPLVFMCSCNFLPLIMVNFMSSHVSRRGYARIGLPPCFFSFSSLSLSLEVIPLPTKRPVWQGTDTSSLVQTWAPEAFQQPYLWVSLQEESSMSVFG